MCHTLNPSPGVLQAELHVPGETVAYRTQQLFVRCEDGFGSSRLLDVLRALAVVLQFELKE